jgi:1,4-alpha-glucan branching enzyme
MWFHPGKKLLFMGDEFGQPQEWNFDESLSWHFLEDNHHSGLSQTVAELNTLLRQEPALHQIDFDGQGFEWIDCQNWNESIISFLRKGVAQNDTLAIVYNFTPVPRRDYRVGVPLADYYTEVFNSDAAHLGGSNILNKNRLPCESIACHGREHSVSLTVPPLAAVALKPSAVPHTQ